VVDLKLYKKAINRKRAREETRQKTKDKRNKKEKRLHDCMIRRKRGRLHDVIA
jgi:hypothetical protein